MRGDGHGVRICCSSGQAINRRTGRPDPFFRHQRIGMIECRSGAIIVARARDNGPMRQLQMFTTAELAAMRDRTASRKYSPAREEFRRTHQRHRAWGLARRHAERLRHLRNCASDSLPATTAEDLPQHPPSSPACLSAASERSPIAACPSAASGPSAASSLSAAEVVAASGSPAEGRRTDDLAAARRPAEGPPAAGPPPDGPPAAGPPAAAPSAAGPPPDGSPAERPSAAGPPPDGSPAAGPPAAGRPIAGRGRRRSTATLTPRQAVPHSSPGAARRHRRPFAGLHPTTRNSSFDTIQFGRQRRGRSPPIRRRSAFLRAAESM